MVKHKSSWKLHTGQGVDISSAYISAEKDCEKSRRIWQDNIKMDLRQSQSGKVNWIQGRGQVNVARI